MTSSDASAAPVRALGTRSRAGNAMSRTRAGLLDGARRAVEAVGPRRTTMNDIAAHSGVAKATLYNHFRSREHVWSALVEAEVRAIGAECAALPLSDALAYAAGRVSTHPVLQRVRAEEPVALAGLLTAGDDAAGRRAALECARQLVGDMAGVPAAADVVVRWLSSYVAQPAQIEQIRAAASRLAAALAGDQEPYATDGPRPAVLAADGGST